jgi:hypothetical protein
VKSPTDPTQSPIDRCTPPVPATSRRSAKTTVRASALGVLLTIVAAGCGGSSDSSDAAGDTSGAGDTVAAVASDGSPDTAAPQVSGAGLGAPTNLAPATGKTITAAVNGRTCTVEGLFGTCQAHTGSGGPFAITVESDPKEFSKRTLTVYCGVDNAAPAYAVSGELLFGESQLTFPGHGEAEGITSQGPNGAEAVIVFRPAGAGCAQVFGLGPIQPGALVTGSDGSYMTKRPDGSSICVTATADSFAVTEGATACPA